MMLKGKGKCRSIQRGKWRKEKRKQLSEKLSYIIKLWDISALLRKEQKQGIGAYNNIPIEIW